MDIHASEQEQLETVKKWWKENGTSLVSGILIGLAVLLGAKAWFGYQDRNATNASHLYAQMLNAIDAGRDEEARAHANNIISGFSNTGYAPMTALALARIAVKNGELEAAQTQLQWALDHANTDAVRHIARQRLVRVLIARENYAEAQQMLDGVADPGTYAYQYAALRGDLSKAQGQLAEAAQAYKSAIEQMPAQAPDAAMIRIQFEMLAGLLPETDAK